MKKRTVIEKWIQSVVLLMLTASDSQAIVLYMNPEDIDIPITFEGVYLDVETGSNSTAEPNAISGWDWDLNFVIGGMGIGSNTTFHPVQAGSDPQADVLNLSYGTEVGATTNFYGSGFSGSEYHMGSGAEQFISGTTGYLGFRFEPDTSPNPQSIAYFYGWMQVTLNNTGGIGTIHEWAYETSGQSIYVGFVPEPAACATIVALIAAASIGLRRRGGVVSS